MAKADGRASFPPNLASVLERESVGYDTSSIRAIKKDVVKEQRKQFEKGAESLAGNVQPKVLLPLHKNTDVLKSNSCSPLHKNTDVLKSNSCSPLHKNTDVLKSISCSALRNSQSLQDDYNDSNFDLLPNSGKPSSPVNRVAGSRKTLSVKMEVRLSVFEKSASNADGGFESPPAKPDVRPKPEHLSLKSAAKSPSPSLIPSGHVLEWPALPPSSPSRCSNLPKDKHKSVLHNVSQEIESRSFVPKSCPKDVPVLRFLHSPETEKQLPNYEDKGFEIARNNQIIGFDHAKGRSSTIGRQNFCVVSHVDSCQGIVKTVSPPPKPPRLLSEINQAPVPKPRKEPQVGKGGTYEHLTDSVSVVRTSDSKMNSREVSSSEPSPPNCHEIPATKFEPSKSLAKVSADRSKIDQWWESKFIRAPQPRTPRTKENLHAARINNPCYMYAKITRPDDVIVGKPLVRHHSDEVLDSAPAFKTRGNVCETRYDDGPVYHSPVSGVSQNQKRHETTVMFDKDGYAIPALMRDPHVKVGIDGFPQSNANHASPTDHSIQEERSYVKSKVSNAYSLLRLPMFPDSHGPTERDEEGDYDIDLEEHKRLLRHVSNVKYKTDEAVAKYERVRLASPDRLFQYAMIIGLCDDGYGNNIPKMLFCFPKEITISEKQTSSFCFPDADCLRPSTDYNGETFSFVLTNDTGDRRYGLCKRYLPPGSGTRLPEALCVVSVIGDSEFYGRLLSAVKESRFLSMDYAEEMLQLAYAKPFPQPNQEVYLCTVGPNSKRKPLILKRMPDLRLRAGDFSLLLSLLDVSTLIKVFSAILLERKIIFIAKSLSTLSVCICAVVSLLYPFEWQHTFVTILPSTLTDVVQAPTPYILGLLSSGVSNFTEIINELDEVLVVDLDNDSLLRNEGDESCIIPKKLQKALTLALCDDQDGQGICFGQKPQGTKDATVAEAFLRLFLETCGHYTEYVCCQQDGEIVFQRELFVKAVHSRSIRLFLEWFTQTQMFSVFVTGRLKGDTERGYFEERILEYRQEMEETTSALENVKAIGKKIADFFQKSGDKLRKTFQKAVYV